MAHLLLVGDSYSNFHQCFKIFMDKRARSKYKSGFGAKLREIKLYDLIYDSRDEEELFKDLKAFEYNRVYKKEGNRIMKFLNKIIKRFIKVEPISLNKYEPTKFEEGERYIQPYGEEWFMYLKVLGKMKDHYDKDTGEELL